MPEERCNDELDWGELGWWCEREPGHDGPHRFSEDGPKSRPFVIEWADERWWPYRPGVDLRPDTR